jgi:hypothetical protein
MRRGRNRPAVRSGGRAAVDPTKLVDFLEALYRWNVSDEEWLQGLCGPVLKLVPRGLWVMAYTYDVSDYTFKCPTLVSRGGGPPARFRELFGAYASTSRHR